MHSKWKLWDFFKSNSKSINSHEKGLYAFYAFDPLVSKLFIDNIPRDILFENKLNVLIGNELTTEWIDSNLQSLGLFGNSESYIVHMSEKIPKDVQEKILNESCIVDERYLVFIFNEQNDFYKKLVKLTNINSLEVSPPMFWENKELLEFFSSYLRVFLDYESSQAILDSVEPGCSQYYNLLTQLKLNFEDETITKDKLLTILEKNKIDQFELASLFSSKRFVPFYNILIERLDSKSSYSVIYFMQSHLLKLRDTSYLDNKKKLSKYDRQILSDSKMWSRDNLEKAIHYFKFLETQLRENDELFLQTLKKDLIKSY